MSNSNKLLRMALIALCTGLTGLSTPAMAAPTVLENGPLANSTTTAILPNIMMDLDNSGSMMWDYMPDYVRYPVKVPRVENGRFVYENGVQQFNDVHTTYCRGVDAQGVYKLMTCEPGDPPYFAASFNSVAYNPDVKYSWPVNPDGTRKSDGTGKTSYLNDYTSVASDGYKIQTIDNSVDSAPGSPCLSRITWRYGCTVFAADATINLVNGYPERVWCKSTHSNVNGADCVSQVNASGYIYPDTTYRYMKVKRVSPYYYRASVEWCSQAENSGTHRYFGKAGSCQAKKDNTYQYVRFFNWSRVNLAGTLPPKAATRTDCAAATCTYAEEMSNFANWYAWYRTRMQLTKSAIGLAFSEIRGTNKTGNDLTLDPADPSFLHARIGLTTINDQKVTEDAKPTPVIVNIRNFDKAQKETFYSTLYAAIPAGGTPLRDSLNLVGRMYQGKTDRFEDPLQYSCQKNFTILATDGYWNDGYSGVGNTDGAANPPSKDFLNASNTLADLAYYYYHTDLRTDCTGTSQLCNNDVPPSGNNAEVDDVAQHQHMTTFTISLGVDGTLTYNNNYKNSTTGDYAAIKQGTLKWPIPVPGTQTTIDDLWHAAVNGRGTYFSTRDPSALEDGLLRALSSIERTTGSGAAAATSNLQPSAGDNFIYIATYRTAKWDGELSAYSIDLSNGQISAKPVWQAETLLKAKIGAAGNVDTRTIYTSNGNTRTLFKSGTGGLTADQLAYFDNKKLSQYIDWTPAQKTSTTSTTMVNALRGHDRNEDQDRAIEYGAYDRLYRDREHVLGDVVHAQPVFVRTPQQKYGDEGYSDFKSANANRLPTIYLASNNGMLHAIDGATGEERWAYVPPIVMPEMWRLLDTNYGSNHRFFLDGPLSIGDAKIGNTWKTILIGALGKGGRGIYALDVTNPVDPKPLWTFSANENKNVGFSFGTPTITKLKNGEWVVVMTSGYNNIPDDKYNGGDGKGYIFILDVATGTVKKTITTGEGSTTEPSGLARLNLMVDDYEHNNTTKGAYGGDLYGNMWRFDLDTGTASKLVAFGKNKPIMVAPEIADISGKTAVFFGTGRYLGKDDLLDLSVQTLYGIKDDGTTTLIDTSKLVEQTITPGAGETRNITNNAVDWTTKFGWFVNLTDSGERVNVAPQLYFGTLLFATTVPSATACQPGGYSWLYALNYANGGNVKPYVAGSNSNIPGGKKYTSPIVGMTVAKLPTGTPIIFAITADGKRPNADILPSDGENDEDLIKRVLWRELFE